jgi:hypothetical protein
VRLGDKLVSPPAALKRERPENLSVQQITKIELVINLTARKGARWINLKTAKALGPEVPSMLLARADEVKMQPADVRLAPL